MAINRKVREQALARSNYTASRRAAEEETAKWQSALMKGMMAAALDELDRDRAPQMVVRIGCCPRVLAEPRFASASAREATSGRLPF